MRWPLATVCVFYLVIAASYSLMIPAWESNDEADHVAYIEHIITHGDLPRIARANGHESHQPPLYYALAALWQRSLGIAGFAPDLPALRYANISSNRPTDQLLLGHDYSPEQRKQAVAVHEIRVFSIFLGLMTVILTYFVGRTATGRQQVGLAAAMFPILLPKFDVVMGTVTNDALVIMLSSLALLITLNVTTAAADRRRLLSALLGLVLGAAAITKTNALLLVVPFLGVVAFTGRLPIGRRMADTAVAVVGMGLVGGWWFVRNLELYGDPLAHEVTIQYLREWFPGFAAPASWTDEERFGFFVPEQLLKSTWYTGGWNQFYAPTLFNLILAFAAAICLFAAVRAFIAGRGASGEPLRGVTGIILGSAAVAGLIAVLLVAKETTQAEGRITFIGLAAFATLATLGAHEALPFRWRGLSVGLVLWPLLLGLYNLYVVARFVMPSRHL
jgi:hypothetical protein